MNLELNLKWNTYSKVSIASTSLGRNKKLSFIWKCLLYLITWRDFYHLHYIISIIQSDYKITVPCPWFYSSMVPLFRSSHQTTVKSILSPMLGSGSKYESEKNKSCNLVSVEHAEIKIRLPISLTSIKQASIDPAIEIKAVRAVVLKKLLPPGPSFFSNHRDRSNHWKFSYRIEQIMLNFKKNRCRA